MRSAVIPPSPVPNPIRRRVLLFLRLFVGLGLLGLTIYLVDWTSVLKALSAARPGWILAAGLLLFLTLGLKLYRWGLLLNGTGLSFSWFVLGRAFFSAQAANILLPVRGGEIVRLGISATAAPNQVGVLAASITLEKVLDFAALLLMSLWVWNSRVGKALLEQSSIPWINLGLLALLLALIPLFRIAPPLLEKIHVPAARTVLDFLLRVQEYLRWIARPARLAVFSGLTLLIWVLMGLTNLCVLRAVALPADLDAAGAVLVLIYVGIAPALMPGNLGPFLFLAGLGLTAFGYPTGPAFAFAVLLHLLVTIPPLILSAGFYLAGRSR